MEHDGVSGGGVIQGGDQPQSAQAQDDVQAAGRAGGDDRVHGLSIRLAGGALARTPAMPWWLLWLVLAANGIDWAETVVGVGWLGAHELMDPARWWISRWGIAGLTLWKLVVTGLVYAVWRAGAESPRWRPGDAAVVRAGAWLILGMLGTALWLVVVANFGSLEVLVRHGR